MLSLPIRRALISVSDKSGLVELGQNLEIRGIEILSTGGSAATLRQAGVVVTEVSDHTGSPEIMGGRIKTLHPKIHGGLLGREGNKDDERQMDEQGIQLIDLLIVNLYPFEETIASGADNETCIENIDIGGPALIRAASKNHHRVTVITGPEDYQRLLTELEANNGGTSLEFRKLLAAKAYRLTSAYDAAIAEWFAKLTKDKYPERMVLAGSLKQVLRYGENPHQGASLYASIPHSTGIVGATQLHGKDLSFNNLLDADAAWQAASDFPQETVAIVKHTNTCGIAAHPDLAEAYRRAHAGDPISAYGGIVAFNRTVTAPAAEAMRGVFYEVVIAPDFDDNALLILQKRRGLRILKMGDGSRDHRHNRSFRPVSGGILLQDTDRLIEESSSWSVVTSKQPTPQQFDDLAFAWRVAKHIKSNAIVLVKEKALIGMGAGQPNRLTSVHLALKTAGDRAKGCVLASDAFFPFADGVELAVAGGIEAVIQPGGSIRDSEVVSAANSAGISMVTTGVRHFLH